MYLQGCHGVGTLSAEGESNGSGGFMSFSKDTIVGDIAFLALVGVAIALVWPARGSITRRIESIAEPSK